MNLHAIPVAWPLGGPFTTPVPADEAPAHSHSVTAHMVRVDDLELPVVIQRRDEDIRMLGWHDAFDVATLDNAYAFTVNGERRRFLVDFEAVGRPTYRVKP